MLNRTGWDVSGMSMLTAFSGLYPLTSSQQEVGGGTSSIGSRKLMVSHHLNQPLRIVLDSIARICVDALVNP